MQRRTFFKRTGAGLAGFALTHSAVMAEAEATPVRTGLPTPDEALRLLQVGNVRFQKGQLTHPNESLMRREMVAVKQEPFAMVFACADSREAPELLFDEGLGDLFVIRTAGHVLDQAALGSIEFGVAELHIPLLVVLGHKRCGAIKATLDAIDQRVLAPGNIEFLASAIRPAAVLAKGEGMDKVNSVVRANVSLTIQRLQNSMILANAQTKGQLKIVGGFYDLDTGAVEFLKST